MGKARILEAHGEGRYTIEIIEARERAEIAKEQAEARITQLQTQVSALTQQINAAQSAFAAAVFEQNAAIEQYQQEMAEEGSSSINLAETAEKVMTTAGERDKLRVEQRGLEVRIKAAEALVARINSLPPLRQMQAWCADYTEDLNGEVATAEVPGEIGSVIIKPGFEGANQWSAATDGAMQPTLASTPAATFWNLAMLPGWQKWRPTFRTATITSLDGDTCSISLDAATSSQQGLGVNAQSSYSAVPILYMDCNGGAFEEGDKALVAFAGNVDGPTVVGFESEPRMCTLFDYITISTQEWNKPDVDYNAGEYAGENWILPNSLGMPVASGDYQSLESIAFSNITADINITHTGKQERIYTLIDDSGPFPVVDITYAFTCDHSCILTGHIQHLGEELSVSYSAALSGDTTFIAPGFEVTDLDAELTREFTWGATIGRYFYYHPQPFLSVDEVFTVGGYSVDITKISDHLYQSDSYRDHADWIRYYPTKSLFPSSRTHISLRGTTKPYSILLPDMVSFYSGGKKGVLIVFSSTGQVTATALSEYLEYFEVEYRDLVRSQPNSFLEAHNPDSPYANYRNAINYRLQDRKLHVCITLLEIDGVFVRHETPDEVLEYYKQQKVRGNLSDSYYDLPLSVNVS